MQLKEKVCYKKSQKPARIQAYYVVARPCHRGVTNPSCTPKASRSLSLHRICHLQVESIDWEGKSVDSRGIPGWDKVNKLARALLSLSGLSVTNAQATQVQHLYEELVAFDKRLLVFQPRAHPPPRGRFGRTKGGSHIGVEYMKRCFNYPNSGRL